MSQPFESRPSMSRSFKSLSSRRGRLLRASATGVVLVVAAGATMSGSATAAEEDYLRCPRGYFCLFTGIEGKGGIYKYRTSQSDFGAPGRNALSWINRTKNFACLWPEKNYTLKPTFNGPVPVTDNPAEVNGDTTSSSMLRMYRHHVGSMTLAPTRHECEWRKQYIDWTPVQYSPPGTPKPFGSFLGNGQSQVLMRSAQGRLWVLPGDLSKPPNLGTRLSGMTVLVRHGDYTGDGREDIFARDKAGVLWLYPGNGKYALGARRLIAYGWNNKTAIAAVGDITGDKKNDLMARDKAGALWLYPGNGRGGFGARTRVASGWNTMTALLGPGDLSGDGKDDIVGRDNAGALWLYPGNGKGGFGKRVRLVTGVSRTWKLFAPGDVTGDGRNDIYAVDALEAGHGELLLFSGTGKGLRREPVYYRTVYNTDSKEVLF
ncbi:FG-GAP-like repeat-containing protein [Planotetraspora phitsanulokensis]|uniref:ATP/GTP-binding protein n=2 Tax=Planotetraspora phitsanulokensis TaxID=575192 RepID=A0A8J3U0S4_9ACTN|nr:ATP/GTP-binding protein [Planotetraspora phitsanulokensis]